MSTCVSRNRRKETTENVQAKAVVGVDGDEVGALPYPVAKIVVGTLTVLQSASVRVFTQPSELRGRSWEGKKRQGAGEEND